jgi:protein involved in plasmid replication-relaxation
MYQQLTSRDIAILQDVYAYRYLTTSQLKRLHFPSEKTAWRRLQILSELGFIKPFTSPAIPERIFYLNKKGAEIISVELQVPLEELSWNRLTRQPKDYYFLRHFLAINDFRILITQACEKSSLISLLGFIPEYMGEQTKDGYVKKLIRDKVNNLSHTPDAVFSLEKEGKPALFFLEIDRGTEIVSDPEKGLLKAVVFYLHYWKSQHWHQYKAFLRGDFKTFRTLIVTTSKQRVQHLREATSNYSFYDSRAKRFLWATTEKEITLDWIFEPIWQSMDVNDPTRYKIG